MTQIGFLFILSPHEKQDASKRGGNKETNINVNF